MKKLTKKDISEMHSFNRRQKQIGEPVMTEQEYLSYIYGNKKAPTMKFKKMKTSVDIPSWAVDHRDIKSTTTDHVAVKNSIMERLAGESDETISEIMKKKNRIAIPYSKGAYQYINDESLTTCLGRKL